MVIESRQANAYMGDVIPAGGFAVLRSKRSLFALVLACLIALAPALAEARGGGGISAGSRGTRTYQSAPPTQTAPAARPVERSATTPAQAQRPMTPPYNPAQPRPSWFQRNPFMSGLFGGLLGAGLIGMVFGGGFFGAGFGMTMLLGLVLQLALIGGLVWLVMGFLRRRASPVYAMAGGPSPREGLDMPGGSGGGMPRGASANGGRDEIGVSTADLGEFERLLGVIQGAWSSRDLGTLRRHLTPEMADYFSDALATDARRGVVNKVEQVKLEQGDVAESWAEADARYATVAMRWSAVDYDQRQSDGAVVSGSTSHRSDATEVWTFRSDRRGPWVLSAIQQV
jgi:predicted lipid-binding transport protein (Tim44 family)